MLSVSTDTLAWLACELSLPCVEDGEGGVVRAVSGAAPAFELAEAAARMAGLPDADADVTLLVERARAGGRGVLEVDGALSGLLMAWNVGSGRARVLFAARDESTRRRAAAAELAAGVTHEVANALTAIAGWTRMAASSEPLPERTLHALEVVQRSARDALCSARGLLRTMRDAGRSTIPPGPPDATNVSEIVGEVLETARPELDEAGLRLETMLAADAFSTTPQAALRLVVSNLVRNALEALAPGDTVRVSIEEHGAELRLTVADDGPGMSAATLSHAFDRYFTTKALGTGLGLALVADTVREAGGRVEVESHKGVGTRIDVWLPTASAPSASSRPASATTTKSGVHPRPTLVDKAVLVVDDDEAMRALVRTALELHGARVHTAGSMAEALALPQAFALALVDLGLGEDRGDALLATLRAGRRVERAILLTGSPDAELDPLGTPDAVLRKPFELEELIRAIDEVLEASPLEAKA